VSWPAPTRADHEKFCRAEGWTRVRNATGGRVQHHATYELALPDGRILRTRISHPPDRSTYGASMWSHILRDQMDVSESDFWACVQDSALPARSSAPIVAREPIPVQVAYALIHTVHLSDAEVGSMTKEQAIERLTAFWTTGE
jgi:hypothetical protein